jgi:transcriptional regulator with XRE-family HTH domain
MIVARRHQLGMRTQQDLADKAGVSLATVSRLETGRAYVRRPWTWDAIETALKFPSGYFDRYVRGAAIAEGFVIQASELSEIEPRARAAIKNALMATLPDATVSEILAAESAAIKALRDQGLLPPEE